MLKLTSALTVTGLAAALSAAPIMADAKTDDTKTKHRVHHSAHVAPPPVGFVGSRSPRVETDQRSWLDPGVGPQENSGQGSHYVQSVTTLSLTPDQMYTGRFGNETLPRRFEIPTDEGPQIEFWTPAFR
jgi:hypothetical protein